MTALDVFVFLLLIGGAAVGFVRGFVHEVISILAWIVGIAMLKLFHTQLWTGLENTFHTSVAAGAVLGAVGAVALGTIGRGIRSLVRRR